MNHLQKVKNQKFSWKKRANSFRYSWQGVVALIKEEHNARIHLGATVVVVVCGALFKLSTLEWVAIIGCIAAVICLEAINSAIEACCDEVTLEKRPLIKKAKDYGAAAVLIASVAAAVIGLMIFAPKIAVLLPL